MKKVIKKASLLAWLLCAICTLGAVASFVIWLTQLSERPSFYDLVEAFGWSLTIPLVFSVLGAIILSRQPDNRVGWLIMLIALALTSPVTFFSAKLSSPPEAITPGWWLLLWFDYWSWIPIIFPVFLISLHFPDGRPPSRRWNWVNLLAIGLWLFFIIITAFKDTIGPLNESWTLPNPLAFVDDSSGLFSIGFGIGLMIMFSASAAALFVRYRRTGPVERLQIKWLLYACAVLVVVYGLYTFTNLHGSGIGNLLFVLSILAIAVAIAIAILRYRLYDIDIIIRRTLQYAILTGLLALVYFGSVLLLQSIAENLTGEQSPLVIVLSTLTIAALFNPLRVRVQDFIDRRFFRKKYDAERTLAHFASVARDEVEMDKLTTALLEVVADTMQPERTSLWVNQTGGNK